MYKDTIKALYEAEKMDYNDAVDIDETVQDDEYEDEDTEIESDVTLASMVTVIDASLYTAEDLGMNEDQLEEFKTKVDNGDIAIVFDEDDDNPNLVDIVFEDGLEAFKIIKSNLELAEDEDIYSQTIPTDEDDELEDELEE